MDLDIGLVRGRVTISYPHRETLGSRIRETRLDCFASVREVARAIGFPEEEIISTEAANSNFRPLVIARMAEVLGRRSGRDPSQLVRQWLGC